MDQCSSMLPIPNVRVRAGGHQYLNYRFAIRCDGEVQWRMTQGLEFLIKVKAMMY